MDFETVLNDIKYREIGPGVLNAVKTLLKKDQYLLKVDSSERSIQFRLAMYLQEQFPDKNVDVEYNRTESVPKAIHPNDDPQNVFPDIIIHIRGTNSNLLAIEIKKDSNRELKDKDIKKLKAYCEDENLQYSHGLFIKFGVENDAGTVSECEWVHASQST